MKVFISRSIPAFSAGFARAGPLDFGKGFKGFTLLDPRIPARAGENRFFRFATRLFNFFVVFAPLTYQNKYSSQVYQGSAIYILPLCRNNRVRSPKIGDISCFSRKIAKFGTSYAIISSQGQDIYCRHLINP